MFVEKLIGDFRLEVCLLDQQKEKKVFGLHPVTLMICMFQMLSVFLLRTSTKTEGQVLSIL